MKLGTLKISRPVFLAPLSGITDSVFRLVAKEFGAGLVYTEMISADGLLQGGAKTYRLMDFHDEERPIGVQLYGSRPEILAQAARLVTKRGPDLIDLNFGCPSRKVVGRNGGAAVLKNLTLLERILRSVVQATDLPVTAKIRSGWDGNSNVAEEVALMCQALGLAAIAVHPRSRQECFSGKADWDLIRRVKARVEIPVIGNGDVRTPEDGQRMFEETGCDAIMIGRGALGNPWLFGQIAARLEGSGQGVIPTLDQRIALCLRHARELVTKKGEFTGLRQMRKHFGWYTKGFPGGARLRAALVRLERLEQVREAFRDYQGALDGRRRKADISQSTSTQQQPMNENLSRNISRHF